MNKINTPVPARIHVLLAQNSPQGIIFRRGPSKHIAIIGWDRKNDNFSIGQWLKGQLYKYRCDISPNGKYWIYFSRGRKGQTWTCVAKTPYLTALDFYTKADGNNGGGLFLTDRRYWLNDGGFTRHVNKRKCSPFEVTTNYPHYQDINFLEHEVYFIRLKRDGWREKRDKEFDEHNRIQLFIKKINDYWDIIKIFDISTNYEEHLLVNSKTDEQISCPHWEWADIDKARLLWAEKGFIYAGVVHKQGLDQIKCLFDCNGLQFENLTAPYKWRVSQSPSSGGSPA